MTDAEKIKKLKDLLESCDAARAQVRKDWDPDGPNRDMRRSERAPIVAQMLASINANFVTESRLILGSGESPDKPKPGDETLNPKDDPYDFELSHHNGGPSF